MLIQCLVPRHRVVTLGDDAYSFDADEKGRFVSEVTKKPHVERLLSIDVYRSLSGEPEKSNAQDDEAEAKRLADEAEAKRLAEEDAAKEQEKAKEAEQEGAKEEPKDAPATDGSKDADEEQSEDSDKPVDEMDHDELVAAYTAKVGRKPHHKLSDARIKELLSEED